MFNCGLSFTKDKIWARPIKRAQNRYYDVENSLYQPPACFLEQDFVYFIVPLGEIIYHFNLKK